jgi:hypothetical protein
MPISVQVVMNDIPSCITAFQELQDGMSEIMEDMSEQVGNDLLTDVERRCPGPNSLFYPTESTGLLAASHDMDTSASNSGFTVTVTNEATYAQAVHDGHGTVEGRPWLTESLAYITNQMDTYINMFMDWVASVFEGEL